MVVVVADHVQDKGADHAHRGCVPGAAVFRRQVQAPFHQRLGQGARTQAIRRELLAGQVHQPDVAFQTSGARQRQEDLCGSQQGCRRRVVVICPGCRRTQTVATALRFKDIFHIGGVVVVGHDHGLAAVPAGNYQDDVAFLRLALLILVPCL